MIEEEIDVKLNELERVKGIHQKLDQRIAKLLDSQKSYEQMLAKRSEILNQLRRDCERTKKFEDNKRT